MTNRENYLSIAKRTGYDYMPVNFNMCPSLREKYEAYVKEHDLFLPIGESSVYDRPTYYADDATFISKYYKNESFRPGTNIDFWGVAREPGSAAAYHMTKMYHPMNDFDSVEQLLAYPMPKYSDEPFEDCVSAVNYHHGSDRAVIGQMQCTIWEAAWKMRGMENLFCDMMMEEPIAELLFDMVTDNAVNRAVSYAKAGVDGLFLGDDVGMQHTLMMSEELYAQWIKPRMKRVIDAAKAVNPDLLIFYHSCGHVTELIPHFIEAGVDVLNPIQVECMDFKQIHDEYGDRLSFHGTIGTQTTMPYGTPEEVRRKVFENLDIAGKHGGLYVCPTHLLEPEVPVENVVAYVQACVDYTNR